MPICPACGKTFSGFSFGANPATECADCRKAKEQAASVAGGQTISQPSGPVAVRMFSVAPVTLTIICLNVLVYLAMCASGVSWIEPNIRDAVKWGADFGPLTLNGDWWRLLTSTFVHFGIIHIGLNMWCLWNLGTTLEPFMGRKVFGVVYLASGLAASLVSVAWNPWRVSAGASGAIFGVAGALVSYFALKKTPMDSALVKRNLRSLGIFIFYNLLYGVRGGVDNSAHLGGLIAGLILGAVIPPMIGFATSPEGSVATLVAGFPVPDTRMETATAAESRENRVASSVALVAAAILVFSFAALHAKRLPVAHYGAAVKLIKAGQFDQAAAELQESIKLDPDSYFPQLLLGELSLQQQKPAAAIAALEKASKLDDQTFALQHNLALAYLGTGRPSGALEWVASSLSVQKDDTWRSLFVRAVAEGETGNHAGAVRDLNSVIQAKPDFTEARDALAYFRDKSGATAFNVPANPYVDASAPSPIAIPYANLVMESEYWPIYP
jgi:membrane associated rhomboid family serine protease/thioredoxin-like negative regulator of GroEL